MRHVARDIVVNVRPVPRVVNINPLWLAASANQAIDVTVSANLLNSEMFPHGEF